ncbi:unnamed protein product [Sympodiomycopsis kandeliae]
MSKQSPTSWTSRLNAPKPIFLGWTGMILLAGCGYAYAKSLNTTKKKNMMREAEMNRLNNAGDQEAMQKYLEKEHRREQQVGSASSHGGNTSMSPWQTLVYQFNRQTSGRDRGRES